jgi:glycosyltransferase involved in cell wall biosynthesis/ubiquinone/menaquinone biosynthesis C-methylase UbiE
MEFTGERYVPSVDGEIKYEHLHRYALCIDFVSGKSVLDIASGEGYGSALLAKVADSVVGVDISFESIEYAKDQYGNHKNLSFLVGSCDHIPLTEKSVDVVVSFETIEHHDKHEEMMLEIKRVLKQDGILIISSPNRLTYSDETNYSNPYHVKELYYDELVALLNRHFGFVKIYGQRIASASFVFPLGNTHGTIIKAYTGDTDNLSQQVCSLESPLYYVAVCSDTEKNLDLAIDSLYIDFNCDLFKFLQSNCHNSQSQLQQTQSELERSQSQLQHTQNELERSHSQLQHTQNELERSQSQLQQTQSELERSQNNILAMESSKFWKLRQLWFKAKKILLIDTDFTKIKKSKLLLKSFLKKVLYRLTAFGSKFLPSKKKGIILKTESSIPIKYSTKKKMMLIWPFIAVGGAEGIVLNIVENEIINNEFDFIRVCLYEQSKQLGDLSESFERSSLAFYKAKNFQDPNTILDRINYLIKFHEIKVLFIPSGTSFFYNSLKRIRSKFPNLRIVNQVYDHNEGWIQSYSMLNVSLIDCHIAPNLLIKNKYIEYGVSDDKSPLVYHGINLDDFNYAEYSHVNIEDLKKMFNIPLGKVIVTFAARMHCQKRPLDFLEIAKRFSSDDRFHFLIVGDGDLSNEVEKKIQFYNLSNITKLGFQRPIQNIYLCTDILVITSQYEGLPLVLLEGLSMGIPAISTSVGAISEVIDNENTGILIKKVGDVDSFCNALDYMARNLNFIQNKCRESRYNLAKEFSVETMCKKYLNAFNG